MYVSEILYMRQKFDELTNKGIRDDVQGKWPSEQVGAIGKNCASSAL